MESIHARAADNSPHGFPVCIRALRARLWEEDRWNQFSTAVKSIFLWRVGCCDETASVPLNIFLWEIYRNVSFYLWPSFTHRIEHPPEVLRASQNGPTALIPIFRAIDVYSTPVDSLIDFMYLNGTVAFPWLRLKTAREDQIYGVKNEMVMYNAPYSWISHNMGTIAALLLDEPLALPAFLHRNFSDGSHVDGASIPEGAWLLAELLASTPEGHEALREGSKESASIKEAETIEGMLAAIRVERYESDMDNFTIIDGLKFAQSTLVGCPMVVYDPMRVEETETTSSTAVGGTSKGAGRTVKVVRGTREFHSGLPANWNYILPLFSKIIQYTDRYQRRCTYAAAVAIASAHPDTWQARERPAMPQHLKYLDVFAPDPLLPPEQLEEAQAWEDPARADYEGGGIGELEEVFLLGGEDQGPDSDQENIAPAYGHEEGLPIDYIHEKGDPCDDGDGLADSWYQDYYNPEEYEDHDDAMNLEQHFMEFE
ncbi:hypothetical protein GGS23DRAFT_600006 [Durotheca rogersii]|uniref:uncharacterized protein n=1 Tax=Durotheca rogersii TaxID=419775 RepID=UPI00221FB939|nr:uncharacterized protein GGS23DRAFT_600006 [Durotheca rogersii]KAI5859819.1 hypothetical protein GGS23DRAFT_600006 [Durotheca rogersii]